MAIIRFINPNSSVACSAGIAAALAPFRRADGPVLEVETLAEGPPGIYSWQDWHAVVGPLCARAAASTAEVFVVACASDPGIEAVRAATSRPVLGIFRCAVTAALARAERFGVVALVDASIGRHAVALRSLGVEGRLAGEIALNVSIETLLDPGAARARLIGAARRLVELGAQTVILGCTGMAGHRGAIEQAVCVPVIEPCQAAAGQALAIVGSAEGG